MKKWELFFALLFLAMAAMTLKIVLDAESKHAVIDADYGVATACVTDIQKMYHSSYTNYEVYVRFVTKDGREIHRALATPFPNSSRAKVGQTVRLKYSVSNPLYFYVDYENKGGMLTFSIFAGLSLVFLVLHIRKIVLSKLNRQ